MPIITDIGSVKIVKTLKDNLVFWFAVGRTMAWVDDNNPPPESDTVTVIDDIQGYKKVDTVEYVVEDPSGNIVFKNRNFRIVNETDIYTDIARFLYLSAWLVFDQFPVVTFRQTGLFVDVVPTPGNEGKDVLLPSEVSSSRMIGYVNHVPRVRTSYGKDLIEMVVEMKGVLTSL